MIADNDNGEGVNDFPNKDSGLYRFLIATTDGKSIIAAYKENRCLSKSSRSLLTRLIIQSEKDIAFADLEPPTKQDSFTISTQRFEALAREVEEFFPGERRQTYFTKFQKVEGQSLPQAGKLWDHYNYTKRILREKNLLAVFRQPRNEAPSENFDDNESLLWLGSHLEPFAQVLTLWNETYDLRQKLLIDRKISVHDYLTRFPCLTHTNGIQLIEVDFKKGYPGKESRLFDRWDRVKGCLIGQLQQSKSIKNVTDQALLLLLTTLSADAQVPIILHLLPYIVQGACNKKRKLKRKVSETENIAPRQKWTVAERREALLVQIENATDITLHIDRLTQRFHGLGLTRQPMPVFVGPIAATEAHYVSVDNHLYKVDTALHAIDLCFKLHMILDCSYSVQASSIWVFLQKAVYGIDLPVDTTSTSAFAKHVRMKRCDGIKATTSNTDSSISKNEDDELNNFEKSLDHGSLIPNILASESDKRPFHEDASTADIEIATRARNHLSIDESVTISKVKKPLVTSIGLEEKSNDRDQNVSMGRNLENVFREWKSNSTNESIAVTKAGILFAAKLHDYPDVPRIKIERIIHDVDLLLKETVYSIATEILQVIEKNDNNPSILNKVQSIFAQFSSPLLNVNTEWKCFQAFRNCGTFIEPVHYSLGEREEYKNKNGIQVIEKVSVTAQFIPIREVFRAFFELPDIYDKTIDYMNSLKSPIISNFVQGSLWQEISQQYNDKIVFPIFLFFDEYETNNPLGSHKGISKCGAVYLCIPCLPPEYQSKVQNIFLFILFNTLDREVFRNKIIFTKAIEELKFLEMNGITIQHRSGPKTIHFVLSLILGDNLGLHMLFGFSTSFNSNFFCRFCLTEKRKINEIFDEGQCTLRNESNYNEQLSMDNVSLTGIRESCIFHDISSFHVTKNICVDVMHDVLEGVCQYDLGSVFHHFIKSKMFSLSQLNDRIRGFFYGHSWSINRPAEILESHIKNKRVMMTSSEMLSLIRHVGLILGPIIPRENDHWQIVIQLKAIVEMVVSTSYHAGCDHLFRVMVSEYFESLTRLFPGCIRPKHHFLIHYARVMVAVGPLWKISSMRFESKHQEGKLTSRATMNRMNICRTIALKHQLRLNYRLLTHDCKSPQDNNVMQSVSVKNLPNSASFIHLIPSDKHEKLTIVNRVEFRGNNVTNNSVLSLPSEDGQIFYIVHCIAVISKEFYFIVQHLSDCYMDNHTQAYQVMGPESTWKMVKMQEIDTCTITHLVRLSDGFNYIVKNWF